VKHWPFSIIKNSPLAPAQFAWELYCFPRTRMISPSAADACALVARDTQPAQSPNMEIVLNLDAPPSIVFLRYPEPDEWAALEPQGVGLRNDEYFLFAFTWQ
jgi:hypothetical protein